MYWLLRLWFWSRRGYIEPGRNYVELWLLADGGDDRSEQRLLGLAAGLHDRFPEVNIRVYLLNARGLDGQEPSGVIRPGAREVALRPG